MDSIFNKTPVSDEIEDLLYRMPKVELHVHLEGATDANTIWELANRNRIALPATTLSEWQAMNRFRDFDHFIEMYSIAASCMRTPEDFAFMTEQFLQHQSQQNVKYCETFLSATFILDKIPTDELIDALSDGASRGETLYGTRIRFIPDIARQKPELCHRVLDFTARGLARGIFIGIGVGGQEKGFPAGLFSEVFTEARQLGLHLVAHAGEADGPQSIWGALRDLQVERIGHGVRAVEDSELIDELRRNQIPLEISPYSNYRLKVVPRNQPHPIRFLVDHGVYVTVNSDDPAMFSTDLTQEYRLLAAQGFTFEELWQLNLNGLNASFLDENEKSELRKRYWDPFLIDHSRN